MRSLRWTNEAIVALARLSPADREVLFRQLDLVAEFPEMYPARQRGRFTGSRYFVVRRRWIVYYLNRAEESRVLIILPARARSE